MLRRSSPQQTRSRTQQGSSPLHQDAAAHDLQLLRQERDALQRERDLLMQQVTMLHTMHQTTKQQLSQAQQMLHEMQHRYDRLLEAPRQAVTVPLTPVPKAPTPRRGADRQASGQTFDPTRHVLGRLCPRGHEYQGMGQSLRRRSNHLCVACDTELTRERRKAKREGAQ